MLPLSFLTAREVVGIATMCGPESTHNYTDAIVVLYHAMSLNPRNAREKFLHLFQLADIDMKSQMNQFAFRDAEFYLGLISGTLYNF
ncbi:MAG: hypothetical protein KGI50_03485 [Patescibacteria group bacterium]|nr:hypothetical protein [Patescibacteria group bacterium]MDE2438354.1 hypothetical protein [Patescibacteria group bacterium]